jgi:hypothetical protein
MSEMVEINWNPEDRILRQFGWIALVGFGILAAFAWHEILIFSMGLGSAREGVAGTLGGLGVLAALLGLVYPKANRPLYVGLSLVAFPIGFVLSYVILGTLFYLVITPIGLVMKLLGRDPMGREFDPSRESYWVDARPQRARDSYFKQF